MKIFIATDHAGFEMKEELVSFLRASGHETEDCGAYEYHETDDYPDFISQAAKKVSENSSDKNIRGIILGGSGEGEAMVANRFPHVRATAYYGGSLEIVKLSREHNDANILSLGARFLSADEAKEAVSLWLETDFSDEERHVRRIEKIDQLRVS
ncbi:MAG TPA: RpiB/LacA/LacB family sugar-phosphate isomerase [Candidatus Paceibacterota bacterium]|nr:RpiB/LacA/LacB family sugar-phosphate isomerase [Candidatus Paceibacterota bacterium]